MLRGRLGFYLLLLPFRRFIPAYTRQVLSIKYVQRPLKTPQAPGPGPVKIPPSGKAGRNVKIRDHYPGAGRETVLLYPDGIPETAGSHTACYSKRHRTGLLHAEPVRGQ